MGASAVFVDRLEHGRRITAIIDDTCCLDLVSDALREAGFHLESIEEGVDTVWDVAASSPDLLVITVMAPEVRAGLGSRLAELRAHPRLEIVPIVLCAAEELHPIRIEVGEHANLHIVTTEGSAAELRELASRITAPSG